jgi:hypothetical protein
VLQGNDAGGVSLVQVCCQTERLRHVQQITTFAAFAADGSRMAEPSAIQILNQIRFFVKISLNCSASVLVGGICRGTLPHSVIIVVIVCAVWSYFSANYYIPK